jgi:hypothetical protein
MTDIFNYHQIVVLNFTHFQFLKIQLSKLTKTARFFKIRLGLYRIKFQKCLINYLGLSHVQTVTSQLYLLVKHCIFIKEIVVVYYDLYDIHEKFEYSCDVTNKAHPHPLLACLLCLKGPTFLKTVTNDR